ncbi:MAG: molybdenum cofactor guanylyltransferase [Candidatus Nezhaarchaeales archaeon]
MRGAVILAGGEGRRFRQAGGVGEKALFKVGGKSMIRRVIDAVSGAVDEWVVTVDTEERAEKLKSEVDGRIVVDKGPRGPLTGVATGLKVLSPTACLVVPCDRPFLNLRVLNKLLSVVEEGWGAAVPLWPNGLHEPLMAAYLRGPALSLCDALMAYGRTRPDDLIRAGLSVSFLSIPSELKPLDPELLSFVNINRPSDVEMRPRCELAAGFSVEVWQDIDAAEVAKAALEALESLSASPLDEVNIPFWHGLCWRAIAERGERDAWRRAAEWFGYERRLHASRGLRLLEARALMDASRCLSHVDLERSVKLREEAISIYRRLGVEAKGGA